METDVVIIIGEDDPGHAHLIKKNLLRSGLSNPILHFSDGQKVLDFFSQQLENGDIYKKGYILLLDIQMPVLDGVEVLKHLKKHEEL